VGQGAGVQVGTSTVWPDTLSSWSSVLQGFGVLVSSITVGLGVGVGVAVGVAVGVGVTHVGAGVGVLE
jgi:hypothetical protein